MATLASAPETHNTPAMVADSVILRSDSEQSLVDLTTKTMRTLKTGSSPRTPADEASGASPVDSEETLKLSSSTASIKSVSKSSTAGTRSIPPLPPRRPPTTPAKVFVPAGIAPVNKPPAPPEIKKRKLKTDLPSFIRISPEPPMFTTPLLDFTTHSSELARLVAGLYRLRDRYFEVYPAKPFPKEGRVAFAQRCSTERNARMKAAHKLVSDRFSMLTKPYSQRKRERCPSGDKEMDLLTVVQTIHVELHEMASGKLNSPASSPTTLVARAASPCSSDDGTLIGDDDLEHRLQLDPGRTVSQAVSPSLSYEPYDTPHGFDSTLRPQHLAVFRYLRGHIANYFPAHCVDAERDLRAATALAPETPDAHISLAECVLKRGDVEGALSVAERALAAVEPRRKEILRMCAMVLRQASAPRDSGPPPHIRRERIDRALALNKEAVQMDLEDGESWFGLGMTHLNLFFNVTQDRQDLLRALKAFDKAATCKTDAGASLPDLYYNRALVQQYLDEVEKAIQDFETANNLDPTAGWSGEAEGLRRMVLRIIEGVGKRGGLRLTKISDVLHALRNPGQAAGAMKRFREAESRSFAEVMRLKPKRKPSATGEEQGKVCIRFAVIAEVEHNRVVPRTLLGMDRDGVVFCVAVYNIRPGAFKVGDDVSVLDPACRDMDVSSMSMKYPLLRIDNPAGVAVNSRPLTSTDLALTTCTCFLPGFLQSESESESSK